MTNEPRRGDGLPQMTEVVNSRTGAIHVSGHLTAQGADLLRGTVEGLRNSGHARVLLDLGDVEQADAAGVDLLRRLAQTLEAEGDVLMVCHGRGRLSTLA